MRKRPRTIRGLNDQDIRDRTGQVQETLLKSIESYYGKDETRKQIVEKIVKNGGEALRMLAGKDAQALGAKPQSLEGLEAIVRTDGSRPSFLIRNGDVDRASSPLGSWENLLNARAKELRTAIASVGRIDVPGSSVGYMGTGFLIAPNLILTNRHVLQAIANTDSNGNWQLRVRRRL